MQMDGIHCVKENCSTTHGIHSSIKSKQSPVGITPYNKYSLNLDRALKYPYLPSFSRNGRVCKREISLIMN